MTAQPSSVPAITHIGQIAIVVKDVNRAMKFYQEALGLTFLFNAGGLVFFQCGQTRLMLSAPEKPEFDHPSSILYFNVADLNGHFKRMKSQGVQFLDEPHLIAKMPDHELWMAFFKDSEGNTLALMSEVRG
jgi:predicted enzyme related to lactoylglutathione lyase